MISYGHSRVQSAWGYNFDFVSMENPAPNLRLDSSNWLNLWFYFIDSVKNLANFSMKSTVSLYRVLFK